MRPTTTKWRKERKGRVKRVAFFSCSQFAFGDFGLKSISAAMIDEFRIETARQAINRHLKSFKRPGKVWIRTFPFVPVTRKPSDVRMGSGKGSVEFYSARISIGTMLFEVSGVTKSVAIAALKRAIPKLGIKCRIEENLVGGIEE